MGAYLIRRGGSAGVVLVGALSLFEAVCVPFFVRPTTLYVVLQAVELGLGVAGVAVAVLAFRSGVASAT